MFLVLALLPCPALAAPQGVKLNGPLARNTEHGGGDVKSVVFTPDGQWVVYLADQDAEDLDGLYSAPFDGSAGARKLSGSEEVLAGFQVGAGNDRVVYVDGLVSNVFQIHSAPVDGSAPPVRLNPSLPAGADVTWHFALSPDGMRVVYHADQAVNDRFELWSVPIDGSAAPVRLNAPLAGERDVRSPLSAAFETSFLVTPDGARVLYVADQVQDGTDELFSVPITGGATQKLSGTLTLGGNVIDFFLSPDGQWVVYRADQDEEDRIELYAVPAGGGVAPVKLNGAMVSGGDVPIRSVFVSSDGARVAYRADQEQDERFEAWSAPIDGSSPAVRLNPALAGERDVSALGLAPGGAFAVFVSDVFVDERFALFAAPLDGSVPAHKLNPQLPAEGDVGAFWFGPDGSRVVYWADQASDGVDELWSVTLAGGALRRLSGPLVPGGDVARDGVLVSASGRVLFLADKLEDGKVGLWSAPLDGSLAPERLDANAAATSDVSAIAADASGLGAAFLADAWSDEQVELLGVSTAGGAPPRRLNGTLLEQPIVGDVYRFAWSPDGTRVLYVADAATDDFWELFSVRSGPLTPPVRLNDPSVAVSTHEPPCWFDPESERVVFKNEFDPPAPGLAEDDDVYSAPRDGDAPVLLIGDLSEGYDDWPLALPGGTFVYGQVQGTAPSLSYHLWNAAIDGSRAPFELLPSGPGLFALLVASPQQDLLAFATYSAGAFTLRIVPADGSAAALTLAAPLSTLGEVRFAPAQDRVYFVGSFAAGTPDELWSVPAGGGAALRLHPPLGATRDVDARFHLTPDGARIVYRADQDTDEVRELYSVPALGGASTKLSGPMVAGGGADPYRSGVEFALTPDGARLVYLADQATNGVPELFSVPVDGSAPAVRLNAPLAAGRAVARSGFRLAPDGRRVVYVANQDVATSDELYVVAVDGSQGPLRLTPPMTTGGGLRLPFSSFPLFELGRSRVLYLADQDVDETFELFSVALDGSQGAVRLSGHLTGGGDVNAFALGARGQVVYVADEERNDVLELFLVLDVRDGPMGTAGSPAPATMVR